MIATKYRVCHASVMQAVTAYFSFKQLPLSASVHQLVKLQNVTDDHII